MVRSRLIIFGIVSLCVSLATPAMSKETSLSKKPLSWGIVPQQSAKQLAKLWSPILRYISQKSGISVRFKTAKDIPTFEQRVNAGDYDIAYMNPYHYTVFHQSTGYQAFAKQKDKRIQGIVVVRRDSNYQTVDELKGQTLVFPSPAAFAASVLPRAYFRKQALSITPKYVSSHDSVYRNVVKGLAPAGGGIQRTFNNISPEIRDQLRILWKTQRYTPHAFAAHPRVAPDVIQQIVQVLVSMNGDPEGKKLLQRIRFQGVETAQNSDWNDVRTLNIDILSALTK